MPTWTWRSRFTVRDPSLPCVYGMLGTLAAMGEWAEAEPGTDGRSWRASVPPEAMAGMAWRFAGAVAWGSVTPLDGR